MLTDINGVKLNVEAAGPASAPAVLLIHSLLSDLTAWDPIATALAGDYRVIRFDSRGHGRSEAVPGPYSTAMMASDAAAVLDHFRVASAHVAGISIGGGAVQRFGIDHAGRALSLAIIASGPRTPPEAAPAWDKRIEEARQGGMATQVDQTLARWFTPAVPAAVRDRAVAAMKATSVNGFIGTAAAIKSHDALAGLGGITVPTLVVTGADDPGTPPAIGEMLKDKVPGARHVTIANAGHQVIMERPAEFLAIYRQFLAGV